MFNNVVVVGVSQVKSWSPHDTVASVLGKLGANSGNMVFTEALCQVLNQPTTTSFSIPDSALEGRDAIVLAAANWINEFEDFSWLADRLEQTQLPVFLIGVGAQADLDRVIPRVHPGTLRLLKIVSERSKVIAARGEFTCEVLAKYGIINAVPTGCPSMLLTGRDGPRFLHDASPDQVVLHGTRHEFNKSSSFQNWIYREAMRNDWELLLQSENADIYYALGKVNNEKIMAQAEPAVKYAYGTEDAASIAGYLRRKGLFFSNFPSWAAHMRTRTFCAGTRIHGTIASILAGTPAVLIAHDLRTLEMAQTMGIPYIVSTELSESGPVPIDRLINLFDEGKRFAKYRGYFELFMDVFRRNQLQVNATLETSLK